MGEKRKRRKRGTVIGTQGHLGVDSDERKAVQFTIYGRLLPRVQNMAVTADGPGLHGQNLAIH